MQALSHNAVHDHHFEIDMTIWRDYNPFLARNIGYASGTVRQY